MGDPRQNGHPDQEHEVEMYEFEQPPQANGQAQVDVVEVEIDQKSHRPVFAILCITVNFIMFIVSIAKNGWTIAPLKVNPMLGPEATVLADLGAKITSKIVNDGEWWRLIAPMFLHAGLFHLLVNMIMLWRLGANLEAAFGTIRISLIYFLSGLFGVLMSAIFLPLIMGVGASGAIYGLVGALFGDFYHNHQYIKDGKYCYLTQLIASSLIGLAIGLFPLLDNFGHIGGWICGIVASTVFLSGAIKDPRTGKANYKTFAVLTSLALLIIMFIVAFAVLYSSVNSHQWCSWCIHLSCLQTPLWSCDTPVCTTVIRYPNRTTACVS